MLADGLGVHAISAATESESNKFSMTSVAWRLLSGQEWDKWGKPMGVWVGGTHTHGPQQYPIKLHQQSER